MKYIVREKKWKKGALTLGILVFILIVIYTSHLLYNLMASWDEVTVVNESGEEVWLTPIGSKKGNKEIGPLEGIHKQYPFQSVRNTRIHLPSNDSRVIKYDYSEQNLQFIIVEFADGTLGILKIEEVLWETLDYNRCCLQSKQTNATIPLKSTIITCPDELEPAHGGKDVRLNEDLREILISL